MYGTRALCLYSPIPAVSLCAGSGFIVAQMARAVAASWLEWRGSVSWTQFAFEVGNIVENIATRWWGQSESSFAARDTLRECLVPALPVLAYLA